jgi:hypothetical protein
MAVGVAATAVVGADAMADAMAVGVAATAVVGDVMVAAAAVSAVVEVASAAVVAEVVAMEWRPLREVAPVRGAVAGAWAEVGCRRQEAEDRM